MKIKTTFSEVTRIENSERSLALGDETGSNSAANRPMLIYQGFLAIVDIFSCGFGGFREEPLSRKVSVRSRSAQQRRRYAGRRVVKSLTPAAVANVMVSL
jgi:hypothetical protein